MGLGWTSPGSLTVEYEPHLELTAAGGRTVTRRFRSIFPWTRTRAMKCPLRSTHQPARRGNCSPYASPLS